MGEHMVVISYKGPFLCVAMEAGLTTNQMGATTVEAMATNAKISIMQLQLILKYFCCIIDNQVRSSEKDNLLISRKFLSPDIFDSITQRKKDRQEWE